MDRRRLAMVAAALAVVAAGCGGGETDAGSDAPAEAPEPAASPAAASGDEAADGGDAAAATVQVSDTDLGEVLVDADGRTLYLFTNDSGTDSTCYEDCAASWPPVVADGAPTAGDGVTASDLATTTRDDGEEQVTYAGHPLYLFAGDQAAGDTNGQEVGGVWFAVTPSGEAVSGSASAASGYGDGY